MTICARLRRGRLNWPMPKLLAMSGDYLISGASMTTNQIGCPMAVIAAIEPEIRRQARAELYASLIRDLGPWVMDAQIEWHSGVAYGEPIDNEGRISDWLKQRAQQEAENGN